MGRGGRRHSRKRKPFKRQQKRQLVPSVPLVSHTPAKRLPPVTHLPSSDEEEEELTDFDLLLTTLGPPSKRLRVEDEKKTTDESVPVASNGVSTDSGDDTTSEAYGGIDSVDSGGVRSDAVEGEAGDDTNSEAGDSVDGDPVEGDNVETDRDPFKIHFETTLSDNEVTNLTKAPSPPTYTVHCEDPVLGIVEEASPLPERSSTVDVTGSSQHFLKKQLRQWSSSRKKSTMEQCLFRLLNSYKDLLFMKRSFENGEEIRRSYLLHAINHVLKTRSRVLKNNARLTQAAKMDKHLDDVADQGLTRPKVLILLPFRECALRTVNTVIELLLPQGEGQVSHRKRFMEEFSEEEHLPSKTQKPKSYEQMFAGNIDDCFRVGVAIKRNIVKLYSEFYSSDIIIASPLGLRTIIGAECDKKRDYDFLSSIEVLIVDQCDVFLMQNWDHLLHIFSHLHLTPREAHGVDISRLREWAVNGWSKYYRQTLIFSSFFTPEINALFNNHCLNYAGRLKVGEITRNGCISQVVVQTPQVFHRISCASHRELPEARLSYFVDKILPDFCGELTKQTAIFIPSYFDFVRVRNHMKHAELSYCLLSEYTKTSQVSRCRSQFFHRQKHFLLYTERLHFFRRYHLRGIHHIVFYSLPLYHEFYPELVNMMEEAGQMGGVTCTVLYSHYELHMLSRIVGAMRAGRMLESDNNVNMVVVGT